MMNFLNHKELKIEQIKVKDSFFTKIDFEDVRLGDLAQINYISKTIEELVREANTEKPFHLIINTRKSLNREKKLLLYNLALYANIKSNELIRSEARLTIPEAIKTDRCSEHPLKKLVNSTPYHNQFQVSIKDKNKWEELF